MRNLFSILPEDFFKPLVSKHKRVFFDCIYLMFDSFKPEISYGVDRETVMSVFEIYFSEWLEEIIFDEDENPPKDARAKAAAVIRFLKDSGWIEYEQAEGHQVHIVLCEYAVPVIESFIKILKDEETEYQSIISQIHATLQNEGLYKKPYELILKGVKENTERLVSELKRLNASIKRHMDKQTNEMGAEQVLTHFFEYHENIGSKAYLRMKTSDNVSYFRNTIVEKLDEFLQTNHVMDLAVEGFMEIEQESDRDKAMDEIIKIVRDVKSAFYRLDEIIGEIDRKHAKYQRNAVMRAKFLLASGNNMEGKLAFILNNMADSLNSEVCESIDEEAATEIFSMFRIYYQHFVDNESLKSIPINRGNVVVDNIDSSTLITEQERSLYLEAMRERNRRRFTRKKINEFVEELLQDRERIKASAIPKVVHVVKTLFQKIIVRSKNISSRSEKLTLMLFP